MDYSKYKYVGVQCDTEEQWDEVYKTINDIEKSIFYYKDYIVIATTQSGDLGRTFRMDDKDRLKLTYQMWVQINSTPSSPKKYAHGTILFKGTRVIAVAAGSSYEVGDIGTIDEDGSSCPYIIWDKDDIRGCACTENLAPYIEPSSDSLRFLKTKKIEIKFI